MEKEQLITHFEHLHRLAELSFQEHKTSEYISSVLTSYGIEHKVVVGTGILAFVGDMSKPTVLLRADIDALPITETSGLDYASQTKGVMHACGHDFHTAVLLATLVELAKNPPEDRAVLGLFQPGEEQSPGGAIMVLESGELSDFDIVLALGLHTAPELEVGTVGLCENGFMASSNELHFRVTGTAGHAAVVPQDENPVWRASEFLAKLRGIAPADGGDFVLNIGKVEATGATNVIPSEVMMEGTLRTFDEEWRRECLAQIGSLMHKYGVEVPEKKRALKGYPVLVNNPTLVCQARQIIEKELSELTAVDIPKRLTTEDFARFSHLYPSLFVRVGVTPKGGVPTRAHTPDFMASPSGLAPSVKLMTTLCRMTKFL